MLMIIINPLSSRPSFYPSESYLHSYLCVTRRSWCYYPPLEIKYYQAEWVIKSLLHFSPEIFCLEKILLYHCGKNHHNGI
ncbi:hypothetical protein RJT34_08629 [Clitoria ternatea]|uniref:Uncharacterized protein n=1 Tax=Clitoria ternatea TaxID=43366 RepID=A0AAN9PUP9_CLITE